MCGHNNNADIALQLQLRGYVDAGQRTLPRLTTPLLMIAPLTFLPLDVLLIAVLWLHWTVSILGHAGRQRRLHPRLRDEHPAVGGARRSSGQSELLLERVLPQLDAQQFAVPAVAWLWAPKWGGQDSNTKNVSTQIHTLYHYIGRRRRRNSFKKDTTGQARRIVALE